MVLSILKRTKYPQTQEVKLTNMKKLSPENIAYIKQEYFKLDVDVRRKISLVAESLADGDEETLNSALWYFSQKKNKKELDKIFKEVVNEGVGLPKDYEEKEDKTSKIPSRVKIKKNKKKK